jgi:beta-glucosidase
MCAKNLVNGTHVCDSAALIGVLEKDWHFPGFVVSDFTSIHNTAEAADAGTSLELPSAKYFGPTLASAVQSGQVSKPTVDEMVHRTLSTMFRLGLFDRPAPSPRPIPARKTGPLPSRWPRPTPCCSRTARAPCLSTRRG